MKSILRIFVVVLLAVGAYSCEDASFLRENPKTSLSQVAVFSNESMVQNALIGVHARFQRGSFMMGNGFELLTNGSGCGSPRGAGNTDNDVSYHGQGFFCRLAPAGANAAEVWNSLYSVIAAANAFVTNLGSAGIDASKKAMYEGEARYLRAYAYFYLVRLYGRVPLNVSPITSYEKAHNPRTKIDVIYKQILEDLTFAYNNMRGPKRVAQEKGFPIYWAALALRGKVYLQMGCILENIGEPFTVERDFTDASLFANCGIETSAQAFKASYDDSKAVYASKAYTLVPNFANLFAWEQSETYAHSSESIYECSYTPAASHQGPLRTLPAGYGRMPDFPYHDNCNRVRPQGYVFFHFRDKYTSVVNGETITDPRHESSYVPMRCTANRLYDASKNRWRVYNDREATSASAQPGDSVWNFPYPPILTSEASSPRYNQHLPFIRKFENANANTVNWNCGIYAMRYAEVILNLAEAAAELGYREEAINYVNELLARARQSSEAFQGTSVLGSCTEPQNWKVSDFSSDAALVDSIMMERRFELMGEAYHEWFDNRRRGVDWWVKYVAEPKNYFFSDKEGNLRKSWRYVTNLYYTGKSNKTDYTKEFKAQAKARYDYPTERAKVLRVFLNGLPESETSANLGIEPGDDNGL